MAKGRLIYVIGASGAGKDSVINGVRKRDDETSNVIFAHRYITRTASAGGENHVALSEKEFFLRKKKGLFAMYWESHGFHYGIGSEIHLWIDRGCNVVVNGSRAYLDNAFLHFPDMHIVHIKVNSDILKERLLKRGRETLDEIEKRISRSEEIPETIHADINVINNNFSLMDSVQKFITLLPS